MIGILGGMGPLATLDLIARIYRMTPAETDQEHLPLLIHADPRMPERSPAILDPTAPSPFAQLRDGVCNLERGGAAFIAIACNTAHYWLPALRRECNVPILDMIALGCVELASRHPAGTVVGILATRGTLATRLYQNCLEKAGFRYLTFDSLDEVQSLDDIIATTKAHREGECVALLLDLIGRFAERGASAIMLGCTELPVVWSLVPPGDRTAFPDVVNLTAALAGECIRLGRSLNLGAPSNPAMRTRLDARTEGQLLQMVKENDEVR